MVEAIRQGECTDCGSSEDNFRTTDRVVRRAPEGMKSTDENVGHVRRELECDCGATATVTITENGLEADGSITHENASWNAEDE